MTSATRAGVLLPGVDMPGSSDQEAALRTPEFQERYARGIADGLESYFRSLGAR